MLSFFLFYLVRLEKNVWVVFYNSGVIKFLVCIKGYIEKYLECLLKRYFFRFKELESLGWGSEFVFR